MNVVGVHRSPGHTFSKLTQDEVTLVVGLGVEGDAHAGATVQHRSREPALPNLRQVHLLAAEVLEELAVAPGALGENVTTRGLDLPALSAGTLLHLGPSAVVEVTGLRNPCRQIDDYRPGLLKAVLGRDAAGELVRRVGIMSVVVVGGVVRPGDPIRAEEPAAFRRLEPV